MRKRGQDERASLITAAREQADADLAQARVALAADTAAAKTQLELDAQQLGQQLADRLAGRTR